MSRITDSLPENPREITRLQQFLLAGILASGGSSLGLLILALCCSSATVLSFSAASSSLTLLYIWASRQVERQHFRSAIVSVCLGLWSISILAAIIVPVVLPVLALTAVLPVVIALPYVSRATWLRLIVGSTLISVMISFLPLRKEPFALGYLPHWLVTGMNAVFVPITSSLIFLLLWQYRNRLNETLETIQARHTALQESEQRLAAQVLESQNLAQRSQLLNRLASQIRNSLELDTILETVVQEIRTLLQIERCQFVWYRPLAEPPSWEIVKESTDAGLRSFIGCFPLQRSSPVIRRILELEILRADDVNTIDDPSVRDSLISTGVTSILSLPIQTASGDIGVVACMHHRSQRHWSDSEVELLQAVVLQVAIAINQSSLYTQSLAHAQLAQAQATRLETALHELQRTQFQLIQSEKMSSLGQLVAGVAHEINNPINFIYGNLNHAEVYAWDLLSLVQLYQQFFPMPPSEIQSQIESIDLDFLTADLPRLINSMQVGAERIREIVKSLRTFSRLDEAEMKAVDIHAGIDSTLMILHSRLKASTKRPAIELRKDYGALPQVECFPGQLNQVFMNLLTNAIDALEELNVDRISGENSTQTHRHPAQEQPVIPRIRISTQVIEENRVAISIADNGLGMTQEVCSQMFNPFFTTKSVGKGTGLGLPICHSIVVEKHKGQLRYSSAPGQGTEFIIVIPIRQ
ncbi:MAG TPA: ATP-binding protein [Waterburya sp.]|jgi:signal transduction histidine kinase